MFKTQFARAALVAGMSALMVAASAAPALADDKTVVLPNTGYIKFIDDGDVFVICDTEADGHGVTGSLIFRPLLGGTPYTLWREQDGGDAGCDKHPYNIGNDGTYWMKICWNGNTSYCRESEQGFNE